MNIAWSFEFAVNVLKAQKFKHLNTMVLLTEIKFKLNCSVEMFCPQWGET